MFTNPTIQTTFKELNGNEFSDLVGFGMYSSYNTTYYYLMDWNDGKIYILEDEWKFISFKNFPNPTFMISIDNNLFMTGTINVWKVDKDLNILRHYHPGGDPRYRGISYNPSNGLIYIAVNRLSEIRVFSLDLTLIRSFSTSPNYPWSITESSNKLYVGTDEGIILVYQDEKLINNLDGCAAWWTNVQSILFDLNGYQTNKLHLFSPNGSFTGQSITTPSSPRYIGFYSKGRFVQISEKQIGLLNQNKREINFQIDYFLIISFQF